MRKLNAFILAFLINALIFAPVVFPATLGYQIDMLLSQVRTAAGGAITNGHVHFYEAGTTTDKAIWTSVNKATPAANPYNLDANGTAYVFGDGLYRIVIHSAPDVTPPIGPIVHGPTVYDRDNIRYEDYGSAVARFTSLAGDNTGTLSGFKNITGPGTGVVQGFTLGAAGYTDTVRANSITGASKFIVGIGWVEDGSNPGIVIYRDINSSDASGHGIQDYSTFHSSAAGPAQYASFFARPTLTGTRNYAHIRGFQSYPVINFTGTVDEMESLIIAPTVTSGTVTTSVGISIGQPSGAGTVVNNYGLSIGEMTKGTSSNYALYVDALAYSYFKGRVGFGNVTPAERITVGVGGTDNTGEAIGINSGNGGSAANASLYLRRNSVAKANISVVGGNNVGVVGAAADDLVVRTEGGNILFTSNAGSSPQIEIRGAGSIKLNGLAAHDNNAAAIGAGMQANYLYKTSTGVLMIVY
jgi:hypothetical protein